jgi:hypothetical protein
MSVLQQWACSHTVTPFDRQRVEKVKSTGGKTRLDALPLSNAEPANDAGVQAAGDEQIPAAQGSIN